jgi:hypothetical protein
MKHQLHRVLLLIVFLAGCSAKPDMSPPAKNCAYPTPGFIQFRESYFPQAIARGVIPEADSVGNSITVVRNGPTFADTSPRHYTNILWNGSPINLPTLDKYLGLTTKMVPVPEAFLDFSKGIPCKDLEAVRKLIEQHLRCSQTRKCIQGRWVTPPAPQSAPH